MKLIVSLTIYLVLSFQNINARLSSVPKSAGQPWPLPQQMTSNSIVHSLDARAFAFMYAESSQVCQLLTSAFNRYYKIIFLPQSYEILDQKNFVRKVKSNKKPSKSSLSDPSLLKRIVVNVLQPCEDYPSLDSDESYSLEISGDYAALSSKSLWGSLRGLETFSQLVYESDEGTFQVNETYIIDYPRFKHRGLLLDSSRHFIDKEILKINLEAMAANKMNVFHWHIVDDQSFPYQSYTYPMLSELGSYDPNNHVYTQADIQEIIEFARLRGIRVIPEFDSPGHTQSWGKAIPILAPCYTNQAPDGTYGPIDPSNDATYVFLKNFVKEIIDVFPDKYIHLGGDEVDFGCWKSNPNITAFMNKMGFGSDYSKLEQYYEQNLLNIVNQIDPKTGYIIWQEVVDNNVTVKADTVVDVWKNPFTDDMAKVTKLGYRTLLSACWYLDYISYGSDWRRYYACEPLSFNGTDAQNELVIGGEACLWGELVDGTNVISRAWPRASAPAERLWSAQTVVNTDLALPRLEEHRCRMIRRGINAQPMEGPGFCDYEVHQTFN